MRWWALPHPRCTGCFSSLFSSSFDESTIWMAIFYLPRLVQNHALGWSWCWVLGMCGYCWMDGMVFAWMEQDGFGRRNMLYTTQPRVRASVFLHLKSLLPASSLAFSLVPFLSFSTQNGREGQTSAHMQLVNFLGSSNFLSSSCRSSL